MAGNDSQEKTEKPTPKKLQDARKEGQVTKSKELTSFFSLITLYAYFIFMYTNIVTDFHIIHEVIFQSIHENLVYSEGIFKLTVITKTLFSFAFKVLIVPVILASVSSGFIAMVQVGGFIITPKAMEIKLDKFNIVKNAQNIFSMQTLKKFVKDMIQLAVMSFLAFYLVSRNIANILYAGNYKVDVIAPVFFKILSQLFFYLLIIYLLFAIIDYIIQRISFMKKMKMSLEEIKKEMKETDGNPQIKQKQRQLHQEMMEEESMSMTVQGSTLVVTNPNHLAIVILYDPVRVKLPAVLMKAADNKALIVKKLAKKHGILMVRDIWLARQLYALAEIKKYIPSTLVAAVADIIGKNMHLLPKEIQESFVKQTAAPVAPQVVPEALTQTAVTPKPQPFPSKGAPAIHDVKRSS